MSDVPEQGGSSRGKARRASIDARKVVVPKAPKCEAPFVRIPVKDVPAGPAPWITLHSRWLDDYRFTRLKDADKLSILLLWLFSARNGNQIPNDPRFLSWRLAIEQKVDVDSLVAMGFLEPMVEGETVEPAEDAPPELEEEAPAASEPEGDPEPLQIRWGSPAAAAALLDRFRRRQPI